MGRWIKKHKGLFIFLCILITLIAFITIIVVSSVKASKVLMEALNKSETAVVERRDLVEAVSATGTVISADSKAITALVSANVEDVYVSVGDMVNEGELICLLDSSNIKTSLEIAELNLKNSGASLDSARRQYNDAVSSQQYSAQTGAQSIKNAETSLNNVKNNLKPLGDTKTLYQNQYDNLGKLAEKYKAKAEEQAKATPDTAVVTALETDITNISDKLKNDYGLDVSALTPAVADDASALAAQASVKAMLDAAAKAYNDYYYSAVVPAQAAYDSAVAQANYSAGTGESTVNAAAAGVNVAKTQAEISAMTYEEQISLYKEQLEACEVRAPFSGVVTSVVAAKGNPYTMGTPMITIEDTSAYEIATEIDEYDISKIKVGQEVVIKTNGTGDTLLDGTVKSIAPRASASIAGGKVTYKVVVTVDTPCDNLRLDMTAKLSIIIEKTTNTVTVPYESIQTDDDGKKYVSIQTEQKDELGKNIEEKVYVETGVESDYYVEILNGDDLVGKNVVVPRSDDVFDIYALLEEEGALGGF